MNCTNYETSPAREHAVKISSGQQRSMQHVQLGLFGVLSLRMPRCQSLRMVSICVEPSPWWVLVLNQDPSDI